MRNTGWYIPYWRKPKKKGKAEKNNAAETVRSEEQLEAVRQRWIERYRRTARALTTLGLSVGSNRTEVQARYDGLRGAGRATRDVEDAYRHLMRVLPPIERRKKSARGTTSAANADTTAAAFTAGAGETPVTTTEAADVVVTVEVYAADEGDDEDDLSLDEDAADEREDSFDLDEEIDNGMSKNTDE